MRELEDSGDPRRQCIHLLLQNFKTSKTLFPPPHSAPSTASPIYGSFLFTLGSYSRPFFWTHISAVVYLCALCSIKHVKRILRHTTNFNAVFMNSVRLIFRGHFRLNNATEKGTGGWAKTTVLYGLYGQQYTQIINCSNILNGRWEDGCS